MSKDFEYKDMGLEAILKALKEPPNVKVGILGDKNSRNDPQGNAAIGVRHEFGIGVPMRSFLRMPLGEKFQEFLNNAEPLDSGELKEIMATKSLTPLMKKMGIIAEDVIAEAFKTGGFGNWKQSNFKLKKVHQTLVETQQLRDSITSKVDE